MTEFPIAYTLHRHGAWSNAYDLVTLSHDERFLRRKRLVTARGEGFLVNLVETISLSHGDALALEDGRLIEVISATETVLVATADFARLAWHSAIATHRVRPSLTGLIIRQDHVLEAMLRQIGAEVVHRIKSFTLKGGAYGNGRTMGHSHGDYDHAAFPFLNLLRNAEPGAGLLALVLWVSTVFPTGSYAYSHGLELEIAGVGGWRRHWIWLIVWHRC